MTSITAAEIIATLGMARHPEGGWYAETFRDSAAIGGRGHSTAIYFLLERGDVSAWHRVKDAAEVWHFYAGSPLELTVSQEGENSEIHRLGPDLAAGERPQLVVPAGWWQTARSLGDWTLSAAPLRPASTLHSSSWRLRGGNLDHDAASSNRHHDLFLCSSMIFSENRYPLFGIMLYARSRKAIVIRSCPA